MDDYSLASLNESKNEWCARLLNVLTPHFVRGIQSIYDESVSICKTTGEPNKYLMTFQNFLSRIPHWNNHIIETERDRIIEASECQYLEDLITCIHVIQLKMLSCMRVSHENKKVDMHLPNLVEFLHTVYINIAKKLYTNVYLFENTVEPMTKQRNNREVELIVRECIINTVRDNIPVAELLRIFMDDGEEHDTETETRECVVADKDDATNVDETNTDATNIDTPVDATDAMNESIVVKKSGTRDEPFTALAGLGLSGGLAETSESAGDSLVTDVPLEVEDLDFPTKEEGGPGGGGGILKREGSAGGEGGISFSDTITEISQGGGVSTSKMSDDDGYSSDREEPMKLKILDEGDKRGGSGGGDDIDDIDLGVISL